MSPIPGIVASQMTGHLSTNSYESIQTVTVGAGGSGTITFSSIPSTFKHLQIRCLDQSGTGSNYGYSKIRFNSDSGSNYSRHLLNADGSTVGAYGVGSVTAVEVNTTSLNTSYFAGAIVDILDYANTNKYKTVRALSGVDQNGAGFVALGSSVWQNTAAISSISIIPYSTFAQNSQFALYGIKG